MWPGFYDLTKESITQIKIKILIGENVRETGLFNEINYAQFTGGFQ